MSKPVISIITICFNAEKSIAQTIRSVLDQDYPAIEYIIIDGGSKDGTMPIINSFAGKISKVVSETDNGLYDALNKGLSIATGEIIGILHSDDFYPRKNVLSGIAGLFDSNPGVEAVSTSVEIFRDENFSIPYRTYKATKFRTWQFRLGMQPPHPGFFIKRQALQKVGNYNTGYQISGDFDWLLRVLKVHRIRTCFSDMVTVYMRDGGVSSSGIGSKTLMNNENLRSLKEHGIYSNLLFIYSKYFIKIFQLNIFGRNSKKTS